MFGGVYGKLSEERTWQQPCRNLVLFYPNVGPGKGFNEVSWPGPISFPLISHDFQYPLSPFFAPQDSVVLVGACDSGMGALFLVSALSPYNNCQWLTLLCAVHSPSWDTLSLGCQVTIMQEEGRTRIPSCQCGDAIFAGSAQPPSCKFCGVVSSSSSPWSLDFSSLRAGW